MPLYSAPVVLMRIRNWNYRRIPLCGSSQKPVRIRQQALARFQNPSSWKFASAIITSIFALPLKVEDELVSQDYGGLA